MWNLDLVAPGDATEVDQPPASGAPDQVATHTPNLYAPAPTPDDVFPAPSAGDYVEAWARLEAADIRPAGPETPWW